jgi:ABC-type branched-subunit amino acid transport system substrate-binding protein
MRRPRHTAAAFALALSAAAAHDAASRELVIGQSLGLTGGGADVAKQYHAGAKCHFDNLNREGGVRGNTLRIVAIDDGGQRDRTVENTKKLIDVEKAFVLFGYTAAAGAQAVFPLMEERGIPMIGIASGGLGVHDKLRRTVFHVRASYTAELDGIVHVLSTSGLVGPEAGYAFIYNQDAKANLGAFEEVAKRRGAKIAAATGIDRNSTDMRLPVTEILAKKPAAIVAITTAKAMAAVIKEARKQGYGGIIVSSSFAGDPLVAEAGLEGRGTIVAQVVPDPSLKTTGVVREFHAALARCGLAEKPTVSSLEGYIAARVLAEGLQRAGANVSRDSLITALESIRKLDLGTLEVGFSPTNHEGMSFVELLIIAKDGRLKK